MRPSILNAIALSFGLLALPLSAGAEIYKCVSASGVVSYSDHPCASANGEKATEVKGSAAISKILMQKGEKQVQQTCWSLSHRISQCYVSIDKSLNALFNDLCRLPIAQFERNEQRESQNQRKRRYGQVQEDDADDLEYAHRHQRKSSRTLQCDALQGDMWSFLKESFGKQISEQDAKSIEYAIYARPVDGREPNLSPQKIPR